MTDSTPFRILGIAGSLRAGSYNRMALGAAAELLPDGVTMEVAELGDIPLFNQDQEKSPPQVVIRFKEQIRQADALLIATPEYNFSIPGVLKNAIDWASRPPKESPLAGKPVAIMGAAPGILGTARAQYHLRQVCLGTNMLPVNRPEVFIAQAADKFDHSGKLTDEMARKLIEELLSSLVEWSRRCVPRA